MRWIAAINARCMPDPTGSTTTTSFAATRTRAWPAAPAMR
jgi:hypothetical protein